MNRVAAGTAWAEANWWHWLALLAGLLLSAAPARAQRPHPTPLPAAAPDSLRRLEDRPPPLAPVVAPTDTLVRITPCPATGGRVRVGAILFAGNHRTVERALRAELNFREGDSLDVADLPARLEANRRRIYNLQLFHAVLVQASCGGTGRLTVLFSVQERWYVLPTPILSLAVPRGDFNLWRARADRWQRIDYGLHLVDTNFRGRAEQLTANIQFGFNRKFEVLYEAPGLGKRRRVGVGFGVSYYQSRSLDYRTQGDTFATCHQNSDFPIQRFYVSGGIRLRHTVQLVSSLDVSYHRELISDTILFVNPAFFLGRQQRQYLELGAATTLNQRNTFAYPVTGRFMQATLTFRQFTGPEAAAPYLIGRLHYAQYFSLGRNVYYSIGAWAQTRVLNAQIAYADARTLGGDVQVRGYNSYIVEGRTYGLLQQGLSFRAWAPPPLRIPFVKDPKINTLPLAVYLNAFADAGLSAGRLGYYPQMPNQLPNQLLASVGLGAHLVTYYDRVFRFEIVRTLSVYPQIVFLFNTGFPI